MDAPDRLGQRLGDRQHRQLGRALVGGDRHRIGADDLQHVRLVAQPLRRAGREQAMGAGDADRSDLLLAQMTAAVRTSWCRCAISSSSTITSLPVTSPMIELMRTLSSAKRCLAATATPMFEQPREVRRLLGVAEVRRHRHRVGKVVLPEMTGQSRSAHAGDRPGC